MAELTIDPETGASPEAPVSAVCSKCKINPRARKNGPWCRECYNEAAALYRLRARPRERFEERVCEWKDCEEIFTWRSTHAKQTCCCKSHYQKLTYWNTRPAAELLPENAKRCGKCDEIKFQAEWSPSQYRKPNGGI